MRLTGRALMALGLMIISAGMVITASTWPLKAALFPVAAGIPVFFMAMADFVLSLFEKRTGEEKPLALDFRLSEHSDRALGRKRTVEIFLWILAFFFLVLFVGFPISVPLFFLLFLKRGGKEGWGTSLGLAALAWVGFVVLFVWLLNVPFQEGWVQRAITALGK